MPDARTPTAAKCTHLDDQDQPQNLLTCPICNDLCDVYDQPRWLCPHCPHCPDFTITQAAQPQQPPTPPDQPTRITGYWSLTPDAKTGDWRRSWRAVNVQAADRDHTTHTPIITCTPNHLDQDQTGLCHLCTQQLQALLLDVPLLLHHLAAAIVGDHRFVEHGTYLADSDNDHIRLEWSDRASRADRNLRTRLLHLANAATYRGPDGWTNIQLRRIHDNLPILTQRGDAPRLAAALSRAVAQAHRAIDRPADLWCYGPCPTCHRDIYQERLNDPNDIVECSHPGCQYFSLLWKHQDRIIRDSSDKLLTVSELTAAIGWAGTDITRKQIEGWIRRGRLTTHTTQKVAWVDGELTRTDHTGYRLGAALHLAKDAQHRKDKQK